MAYSLHDGLSSMYTASPVSREMLSHHTGHVTMQSHALPPVHTVQMSSAVPISHTIPADHHQSPLNYGVPLNMQTVPNPGIPHVPAISIPQQMPNQTIVTSTSISTTTTNSESKTTKAQPQILEKMKQLRDSGKYCDVSIDVKGTTFRAHKNILAAWSPYFDSQLWGDGFEEKDMLIVNYDNCEVFSDLLDFLYSGCIAPRETNFLQLLHLAVSFQIDLLRSYCEEFLRCNLHLGNFVSTYFLARKYRLNSLEEYIVQFLQMNLSDTVKQSEFLSLPASRFNAFLSSGWMEQIKPEITLFLIISWVGCDVRERERYLVMLLRHIDWSTVASDFLLEISRTENFFTTHESSLYLLLQTLFSQGISLGPYTELFPSLRQTYSHLLSDIVQSGLILSEFDTYTPVTVTGIMRKEDATVNTEVTGPDVEAAMFVPEKPEKAKRQIVTREVEFEKESVLNEGVGDGVDKKTVDNNDGEDENMQRNSKEIKGKSKEEKEKQNKTRGRPKKIKLIMPIPPENSEIPDLKEDKVLKKRKKVSSPAKKGRRRITRSCKEENPNSEMTSENEEESSEIDTSKDTITDNIDDLKDENWQYDDMVDETFDEDLNLDDGNHDDVDEIEDIDNKKEIKTSDSKPKGKRTGRPRLKKEMNYCPHCDFSTNNRKRFICHIKRNHQQIFEYRCNICNFQTKWNKQYYSHMRKHFQGPRFLCDYTDCEYKAEKLQVLLIHRLRHGDERPFACDQCGMRFRTRNNLYAHVKLHSGLKPFTCEFCNKSFATKNTMEQHLVTHSDHRPYLCDTCGFSTKYQSHLISHRRTHTGDVFPCDYPNCTYTTPKKSQLKAHMRSHLGIRNFQCQTCGKSFIEKSHLVRHERTHLDIKPFKCSFCDYGTSRADKLKDHVEKHHGENASARGPYKRRKPRVNKRVLVEADYMQPHPTMVNLDHGAYAMQQPQTDSTTASILHEIRTHITGNLDQLGVTVPIMSGRGDISVHVLDEKNNMMETSGTQIISSPGTPINTPGAIVGTEADHQAYIHQVSNTQNHMAVPLSIADRMPQAGQPQDYGGLSAFMALF